MNQENKPCAKACETCPFRAKYLKSFSPARDKKNAEDLKKVWNHFRTGNIGVCQESESQQHVCQGALAVVNSHLKYINENGDSTKRYIIEWQGINLSFQGFLYWKDQPAAEINLEGLGLPWPDPIFEAELVAFKLKDDGNCKSE